MATDKDDCWKTNNIDCRSATVIAAHCFDCRFHYFHSGQLTIDESTIKFVQEALSVVSRSVNDLLDHKHTHKTVNHQQHQLNNA